MLIRTKSTLGRSQSRQAFLASCFLVQVMEDWAGPSWLAHNQSRPGLHGQRGRAHNPPSSLWVHGGAVSQIALGGRSHLKGCRSLKYRHLAWQSCRPAQVTTSSWLAETPAKWPGEQNAQRPAWGSGGGVGNVQTELGGEPESDVWSPGSCCSEWCQQPLIKGNKKCFLWFPVTTATAQVYTTAVQHNTRATLMNGVTCPFYRWES